jgi:hemerythrin
MSGRLPSELSVGFEEIDGQHRLLLGDLEIARAAVDGGDVEAVKAALAAVGDAFVSHFAAEESLMAESGYPDRGKHKGAHDLFLEDLAQLGRELETLGLSPLARHWVTTRLPEWTRFHIQVNDAPLGQFLAARRFRPRGVSRGDAPQVS